MIHLPPLKLQTGNFQLKELSIKDALSLAVIPEGQYEYAVSVFLKNSLNDSSVDVGGLTVEDRTMLVAHYLSATSDNPDFAVGRANLSDYLIGENESGRVESVSLGLIAGDEWRAKPLLGRESEAIERTMGMTDLPNNMHWIIGRMACQLARDKDEAQGDDLDLWLINRIKAFSLLTESEFAELFEAFNVAQEQLKHLFIVGNDSKGLVLMPINSGGDSAFSAARFPASTCVSRLAQSMA